MASHAPLYPTGMLTAVTKSHCGRLLAKDAFTPDTCSRIQVPSSVLLADTSGQSEYNLYPGGVNAA